ncbi:hypothetical protein [Leptospira langatensis]|uniref:hypothetical protein n=1 Tax=Leptospira langatensis TaxID=2484983 RepID=UPI001438588A|nr:hypothetical protein [Leptospira langatensis]
MKNNEDHLKKLEEDEERFIKHLLEEGWRDPRGIKKTGQSKKGAYTAQGGINVPKTNSK